MTTSRKPVAKTATPRKRAPRKPAATAPILPVAPPLVLTDEQNRAQVHAYMTLKEAGLPTPTDMQEAVEAYVAAEQARVEGEQAREAEAWQQAAEAEVATIAETKGPNYIVNTYNAPFSIRLERMDGKKKRIELKALGQRGDMHPITEEDLQDPILIANLELGRIEIITAGQAMVRSKKQVTNISREHTPLAILRNEYGNEYAPGSVQIEAEFNEQGVVVAQVDPMALQGTMDKRSINAGGLQRVQPDQVSQFVPTGGNPAIISQADHSRIQDDIARRKGLEGPSAGLGGLVVSVDPVQRT